MIIVAFEGEAVTFRKCFLPKVHVICIPVSGFLDASKQGLFMLELLYWLLLQLSYCKIKFLAKRITMYCDFATCWFHTLVMPFAHTEDPAILSVFKNVPKLLESLKHPFFFAEK